MPRPVKTDILGIGVSRTTYEETVEAILAAGRRHEPLTVTALAVHGLMTGVRDPAFGAQLNAFDILTPDGQPVRWALNRFGRPRLRERVYGPTLMLRVCEAAANEGVSIYLLGSRPEVIDRLVARLKARFPELRIAGAQPDRFRNATPEEDAEDVRRITQSGAGIVFCGRGCPRQEQWCFHHRDRLPAALVAVGAAFDFHAGTSPQAPALLQRAGLEWAFRLVHEPRRLWRRYLLLNPLFIAGIFLQSIGCTRFPHVRRAGPTSESSRE